LKLEEAVKTVEAISYHLSKAKELALKLRGVDVEEVAEAAEDIVDAVTSMQDSIEALKEIIAEELAERKEKDEEGKLGLPFLGLL